MYGKLTYQFTVLLDPDSLYGNVNSTTHQKRSCFQDRAEASGTGEIKFKRFRYDSFCDDHGPVGGDCYFYFTNIKIVGGDGEEHPIGRKEAPDDTNDVDLTTVIPEVTTVALAGSRSVQLSMEVREFDGIFGNDDVLNVNQAVNFAEIEQGDGWVVETHLYKNGAAELTISRSITSCDTNFTGPG